MECGSSVDAVCKPCRLLFTQMVSQVVPRSAASSMLARSSSCHVVPDGAGV